MDNEEVISRVQQRCLGAAETHYKPFQTIRFTTEREIGKRTSFGTQDSLYSTLYSGFKSYRYFDSCANLCQDWGGIFGFGFSPDGRTLAAACENKCVLLYDAGNAKLVHKRYKTHDDCVNCVRFLDDRIFATCSDDNTVRLWDSRHLKDELRILTGHTNWVKNIEYSSSLGKLITSGFDGNVFAWDINNYSEERERLLFLKETMRTKMTNDESKLIVSTFAGYFLLIHNLDINHLKEDLQGLRQHIFMHVQGLRNRVKQNSIMTSRKRNQVEYVHDFPEADQAKSISTMQVHPHGWSIVSRNTTFKEASEWTCVHDIQSRTLDSKNDHCSSSSDAGSAEGSTETTSTLSENCHSMNNIVPNSNNTSVTNSQQRVSTFNAPECSAESQNSTEMTEPVNESESQSDDVGDSSSSNGSSTSNMSHRRFLSRELMIRIGSEGIFHHEIDRMKLFARMGGSHSHFVKADQRLLYFSEEPNVGRGFIKEQSFSPDGRIIASPFGNHVRLLAFDKVCTEICDNVPKQPKQLFEVANCALLKSSILASTFSPVDCMFVAGARDGSVAFSQPVL